MPGATQGSFVLSALHLGNPPGGGLSQTAEAAPVSTAALDDAEATGAAAEAFGFSGGGKGSPAK
jgi:hypothetical protein